MPGIYHQGGQGGGKQADPSGEQAHAHVLHGTGIDEQTHGDGPENAVAILLHNNSEAEAKEQISRHNGNGV